MTKTLPLPERVQTLGEEIANSISHGIGFAVAVAVSPILIIAAAQRDSAAGIVGAGVFAFTIILLYMTSTLYHSLPRNKAKQIPFAHFIWHIFVMAGTACHFMAVFKYAA